jgi:hypothetical protein
MVKVDTKLAILKVHQSDLVAAYVDGIKTQGQVGVPWKMSFYPGSKRDPAIDVSLASNALNAANGKLFGYATQPQSMIKPSLCEQRQ